MKRVVPLFALATYVALAEQMRFDVQDIHKKYYRHIQRLNAITRLKWKINKKEVEAKRAKQEKYRRSVGE